MLYANAYPRKQFFLEMFTRDISLEDCILDLIDNSLDAVVRSRDIDVAASILNPTPPLTKEQIGRLPRVVVSYSTRCFTITDNCGGISRKDAEEDVFNFGHARGHEPEKAGAQLGAYGIGLKRAIFKIGNHFQMQSQTAKEGFIAKLDVDAWSKTDAEIEDWRIPIQHIRGSGKADTAGTEIVITGLTQEVKMAMNDPTLESRLRKTVAQTYALFLDRHVTVNLNGKPVEPNPIPLGDSEDVKAANLKWENDGVQVTLLVGLAARTESSHEWQAEVAGWYVLCNGRVVVAANKTDLTGWGAGILPQFHSGKFRGFIGLAVFRSSDPLRLPWTTTKRSLNRESAIYQEARNKMGDLAKPVISFLDAMYKPDSDVPEERKIADGIQQGDLRSMASRPQSAFEVTRPQVAKKKTTRTVSYTVPIQDIEKIQKHLRKPGMPAYEIGMYTFRYFMKSEGLT